MVKFTYYLPNHNLYIDIGFIKTYAFHERRNAEAMNDPEEKLKYYRQIVIPAFLYVEYYIQSYDTAYSLYLCYRRCGDLEISNKYYHLFEIRRRQKRLAKY